MTQEEWLACERTSTLLSFHRRQVSERKLRLFAIACGRRVLRWMTDGRARHAIEVAEKYADRLAGRKTLAAARRGAFAASKASPEQTPGSGYMGAAAHASIVALNASADHRSEDGWDSLSATAGAAGSLVWHTAGDDAERSETAAQCGLLRDIFGNPFRPGTVDPGWLTPTVVALATGVYDGRAFDRLPVLADALQDAGCDGDDLLTHLRDPDVTHVRGCWALDLVLGKE